MLAAIPPAAPIVVEALPSSEIARVFAPNRRFAATLAQDGQLDVWAVALNGARPSAHLLHRLQTPPWPDWGGGAQDFVAVSPDGKHVCLRRPKGGFDVRRTIDGRIVRRIEVPEPGYKWETVWTPRGDLLIDAGRAASFSAPPHSRLIRLGHARTLDLPVAPPWTFTPDARAVVGATLSGLALVDLATGRVRRRFVDESASEAPYAFSPDGQLLASSGEDPNWRGPQETFPGEVFTESAYAHPSRIKVWRVADGRRLRVLPGGMAGDSLVFVDRRRLAFDEQVLDVRTGRVTDLPSASAFASSPQAFSDERNVRFPDPVGVGRMVAVSPDGRLLVVPEWDHTRFTGATRLLVWDVPRRCLLRRVDVPEVRNLNGLGFAPNGDLVLTGSPRALFHLEVAFDALGRIISRRSVDEAVGAVGYLTHPSVASRDGRLRLTAGAAGLELRSSDGASLARIPELDAQFEVGLATLRGGGFAVVRQSWDLRLLDRGGHLVATLVAFPGSGWAAWTPQGKAWGSPDGLARLRRQKGDRLVPLATP